MGMGNPHTYCMKLVACDKLAMLKANSQKNMDCNTIDLHYMCQLLL